MLLLGSVPDNDRRGSCCEKRRKQTNNEKETSYMSSSLLFEASINLHLFIILTPSQGEWVINLTLF